MFNKIINIFKNHEAFFWIFLFLWGMGSMWVYYKVEPVYKNKTFLEQREFELVGSTTRHTTEYISLFNNAKIKDKILSRNYIPENFNFKEQLDINSNKDNIEISLKGSDPLRNEIILSSITKIFKDSVEESIDMENQKIIEREENDLKLAQTIYENISKEKEKFIEQSNYNELKKRKDGLIKKTKALLNKKNSLLSKIEEDEDKLYSLEFNQKDYMTYKKEQQQIMRSYVSNKSELNQLEILIKENKDEINKVNKKLNNIKNRLEKYESQIDKVNSQIKKATLDINNLVNQAEKEDYYIKTVKIERGKMVDNKPLKAYRLVFILSIILSVPLWNLKLFWFFNPFL